MKHLPHIHRITGICTTILFSAFNTSAQEGVKKASGRSFHFQQTVVYQWQPGVPGKTFSDYSLSNSAEEALSLTSTLYIGQKLWKNATIIVNPELAGGSGLSLARG